MSLLVTYGEGQQWAMGCLLQEVLIQSGDVSILAWMEKASDYNSFLSAKISVYFKPVSPYIPLEIEENKMDVLMMELWTSLKTVTQP